MSKRFYFGILLFFLTLFAGLFLLYKNQDSVGGFESQDRVVLQPVMPHIDQKQKVPKEVLVQEDFPAMGATSSLTLLAVGDIMLDRSVLLKTQAAGDYNHPFLLIDPLFKGYNLHLANLEGPITTNTSVSNGTGGARFTFTFSPKFVEPLKQRFEFLSLANNHEQNFGQKGIDQTRKFLGDAGVHYFGDPNNVAEFISVTSTYNGISMAFVGYHQLVGTGFENVIAEVKKLDSQVDVVIAMPHWGVEYETKKPYPTQVSDAHALVDAGADIIIGAHPHVVQPIEMYKDKIIFYSLGNFIFDQYFSPETMTGLAVGMTLTKSVKSKIVVDYKLIPLNINTVSQPSVAVSSQKENLLQHLQKYSVGVDFFGDTFRGSNGGKESAQSTGAGFHYQLQGASFQSLSSHKNEFLVIDPDETILNKEQVQKLQKNNNKILAYVSIGEAENYRAYWQSGWKVGNPSFVDEENKEWEGNYKVKFWDIKWQHIILDRIQRIVDTGYDGVYLDIIDAYEYYQEQGRTSAHMEMIEFVKNISQMAKTRNPAFLIVPQNSPELISDVEYRNHIDGLGIEDVWFNDNDIQASDETIQKIKFLNEAKKYGKFILSVDYPQNKKMICEYYKKCTDQKFLCFVSNRELNLSQGIFCKN